MVKVMVLGQEPQLVAHGHPSQHLVVSSLRVELVVVGQETRWEFEVWWLIKLVFVTSALEWDLQGIVYQLLNRPVECRLGQR